MTTLVPISSTQSQKEITANENFEAVSPAGAFGNKHTTTSGLTFGFYGGQLNVDGVLTTPIADNSIILTASATNFVERTRTGTVSANTSGFTAGRVPLWEVVTGTSTITSMTDRRLKEDGVSWSGSWLSRAFPSDANYTLTAAEARAKIIRMTGTLTAQRNVVVPLNGDWIFHNNTAGGFGIQIIGASGTGIVIANGLKATVYGDGTNIERATADV